VPLLWGDFKVVKSAPARMHLINNVLFKSMGIGFVCAVKL
jgi:hypothetical protein